MVRRQAEGEDAVIADAGVPGTLADRGIARRAASAKSKTKALARRLRKSGRMASLTADISEHIERVADRGDRMIESFEQARHETERIVRESEESEHLADSLSSASEEVGGLSGEHIRTLEDLMGGFRLSADSTRRLITVIQNAAEDHSGILLAIHDLTRVTGEMDALSERIARVLERADVTAINAALEAGKAGDRGKGFDVVARMARTAFERFDRAAEEFTKTSGGMRDAHERLSGNIAGASDRIRAIVVMTKGVRNAFDDAAGVIEELRTLTREVSGGMETVFGEIGSAVRPLGNIPGNVAHVLGDIEFSSARIEEQEKAFAEAADSADRLLGEISRIAAADDIAGVLDDVYAATDSFTHALGTTLERLDTSLEAVRAAARKADTLRQEAGTGRERLEALAGNATRAMESAAGLGGRISALRENLENTLGVLTDITRELDSLQGEETLISGELDTLRPLYAEVSRFAGRAGAFSGVLTNLAVNGGIEAVRAEAAGLSALAEEFGSVAAELAELEDAAERLGIVFAERLFSMGRKQGLLDWRDLSGSFDGIVGELRTLVDSGIGGVEESGGRLAGALSGHARRVADVAAKAGSVAAAAESAAFAVEAAAGWGEDQKADFRSMLGIAEKLTTLTDEMYPAEE